MTELSRVHAVRTPTAGGISLVDQRTPLAAPHTFRGKSNEELAEENAQIWKRVMGFFLARAGLPLDFEYTKRPRGICVIARAAAFVVCNEEFCIPRIRLAELAGVSPGSVNEWVMHRRNESHIFLQAWADKGPRPIPSVDLSADAGFALFEESRRLDVAPEIVASAAILAACSK